MKETLIQLYNTLGLISTKGQDTLHMAACLQATEQLIRQCDNPSQQPETPQE